MADSISWLSRLARHSAGREKALQAEKRRSLFQTEAEKVALAAGAEADEEAQKLKRELQKAIHEGELKLEEARNYSAHLAQKCLFEQTRAEAWKAASEAWRGAVEVATGPFWSSDIRREAYGAAASAQEKAQRTEKVQTRSTARQGAADQGEARTPRSSPPDGESRCESRRSEKR